MTSSKEIIDISPLISSSIAVFPGDTPFQEEFLMEMSSGDNLTLSKITSTVHLGAHADAPSHYSSSGASIEKRLLSTYMGKAQVIEVNCPRNSRIRIADIAHVNILASRILFKTKSFPNPDCWNSDFVALSEELINYLARNKCILVGIDTPSIDPADDKLLESHNAVFKHDMAILEGIVLDHVDVGLYELIALPLKMAGADASPVRAVLVKQEKN
ncbi:MAG: cyclase family protein [Bacteriovorax sp.]|jgi:arylformamidase